ncbi:MAG: hypothetical protein JST92_21975 [Deltaproteobacteria bacterium]|nr:hypothetical protein [Deltaproteobacteria bacterium]
MKRRTSSQTTQPQAISADEGQFACVSSRDLHGTLFAERPKKRSLADLKDGLRKHARSRQERPSSAID